MAYEIVGVAFGEAELNQKMQKNPIVFTRVSTYVNWINDNTIDACKCL